MNKTLVLVRHAHRDKAWGRSTDNGISDKGRRQAQAVLRLWLERHGQAKGAPLVLSSPKRRCMETVAPIAAALGVRVEERDVLDEGGDLLRSAREFVKWWKTQAPPLVVACSHGDWIPVCIDRLIGSPIEVEKGAFVELGLEGDEVRLLFLAQEP